MCYGHANGLYYHDYGNLWGYCPKNTRHNEHHRFILPDLGNDYGFLFRLENKIVRKPKKEQ